MAEKRRMTPVELVDKVMSSEHADVVRESVAWVAAEIMEAEVSNQVGAELGEVTAEQVTQRNGSRCASSTPMGPTDTRTC
jgi:transposase-like protein